MYTRRAQPRPPYSASTFCVGGNAKHQRQQLRARLQKSREAGQQQDQARARQERGSAWDSSIAPAKPETAGCPSRARSATSGSQNPASAPSQIARPPCPSPELVVLGLAASRLRPPTRAQGHTAGPRLSGASASSRSMGSGPQPSLPSPGGGGRGRR